MTRSGNLESQALELFNRIQVLDGTALKLIALVSMVFDHVGSVFFPQAMWMRVIGRVAMPVFAFCIAEGYAHTRDRQAYLLRLGLFALISELPFDLALLGEVTLTHQNTLFTFVLALVALMLYDYLTEQYEGAPGRIFGILAAMAIGLLSIALRCDHNVAAVGLVFIFYVLRGYELYVRNLAGAIYEALVRNVGVYRWGVLGFLPLMLYNGKRGRGLKLFFYLFYPAHLLVIWLVRLIVG
jgi:hypothetical protein